ncbi:MAG: hypothetical protein ACHQF0_06875 [Chitinophagales bacterium]
MRKIALLSYPMKNYIFPVLFTLWTFFTYAQDSTKSGAISISLNFSEVPVVNISGIDTGYQNALSVSPVIGIRSKGGWGISYSPSLVTSGNKSGIYMHSISAGYEQYGEKSFDLAFNYAHHIFTNKTNVPYTPLNNEVYFSISYSKAWVKPVFSTSIGFGNDSGNISAHDIAIAGGISHDFSWEDKGIFSLIEVTPSVLLNAATNGYFSFLQVSNYISHSNKFIKYVKKGGKRKGTNTNTSLELSNFEFNLETNFEMGSFSIHPSGSIVLPVSSGTDNSMYGYGEVSLQYHF